MKKTIRSIIIGVALISSTSAFADCGSTAIGRTEAQAKCLVNQLIDNKSNAELNKEIEKLNANGYSQIFGDTEALTIAFEINGDKSYSDSIIVSKTFSKNQDGAVMGTRSVFVVVDVATKLPNPSVLQVKKVIGVR